VNISALHINIVIWLSTFSVAILDAQIPVDQCFFSVNGTNFTSSGDIHNSGNADAAFYNGSEWQGASINAEPPYECENARAIKINSNGGPEDAVGFRLTGNLAQGNQVSFAIKLLELTGNFNITLYTSNGPNFYDDGNITANQVGTLNGSFNNWQNTTLSFTTPGASTGHNWLFLKANSGSGLIANFCQTGLSLPILDLGMDQEICESQNFILDASSVDADYIWSNGSTAPSISVTESGTYSVISTNSCGSVNDEINITVYPTPEFNVTTDTTVCAGTVLELSAPGWQATYLWNDGSTNEVLTVDSAGIYSVTVSDNCGQFTDQVEITYLDPPSVDLGPDTAVCGGQVDYYVANGGSTSTYSWNTGTASPSISITETGDYSVTITNICGSASDNVYVEFSYLPDNLMESVYEFCEGRPMTIDLSNFEGSFLWSDDTTSPIFQVPNPGWHYVRLVDDDSCFVARDTVLVERIFCDCPVYIANSFTPNGDGFNDDYNIVFDCPPYDYELTILSRWGDIMFETTNPNIAWSGRNQYGKIVESGIYSYVLKYTDVYQGFLNVKKGSVTIMKD